MIVTVLANESPEFQWIIPLPSSADRPTWLEPGGLTAPVFLVAVF